MSDSDFDIMKVLEYLPHRYPFLLIDRVVDYQPGKSLVALKNVTVNEPHFPGHFPQRPVMPGVLIIEAMAQATTLLALRSNAAVLDQNLLYYLVGIDKARFKRQVEPGDQLIIQVELLRMSRGMGKYAAEARVGDELAVSAQIMGAMRDAGV